MNHYESYLGSVTCPVVGLCTVILLFVFKQSFDDTPSLTIMDVVWYNIGGALVALFAPILLLSVVPMILLTLWWKGWKLCTQLNGEGNTYEEVDTCTGNPQC